jgi:general secretion pathway protein L
LLNDLSILIPHDTFLQRLQRKGNKLTLKGESASASSLIEQLEASPLLSEVRFSSAVTQLPGSDRERFAITAVVSAER